MNFLRDLGVIEGVSLSDWDNDETQKMYIREAMEPGSDYVLTMTEVDAIIARMK